MCKREFTLIQYASPNDLSWVDEFVNSVRPYVFVRETDNVFIKRPNQAQKLNPQGTAIMRALLDGSSIDQVLDSIGREPFKVRDIHQFLLAVKKFVDGELDEAFPNHAVDVQQFEMGFAQLPILSEVAITYRCNLKCAFCYAGCNCTTNPVGDDREMSTKEVLGVLNKIYNNAEVPSVSFTGGEPTLRPDLEELIEGAKRLGMWVNLITNGTRITAGRARVLASAGLDSAQISLEGTTKETHDRVTGIKGSFDRTVAAFSFFRDAGIKTHSNTTICQDNLHECSKMPQFVREKLRNQKFSMNLVIPTGSAALNDRLVVTYSELGKHLLEIDAESMRIGVDFMWYSPTPMCLFNPIAEGFGNKGCSACDGLLSVAANGDVLPCASYDETVGNILEQDVRQVWDSKRATQFRNKFLAHPSCRNCDSFSICNGACPLYWRRMGFGELSARNGFHPVNTEHFEQ